MRKLIIGSAALAMLAACAVATTGVVPQADGYYTITRQGDGFWVQPLALTAQATQDAQAYCAQNHKSAKMIHTKEIPAGVLGRWPESEVLFRCEP
jgi:hypothetical protein